MRTRWLLGLLLGTGACASAPFGLHSVDGGRLPLPVYPALLYASGLEGESVVAVVWRDDGHVDAERTYRRRESHPQFAVAVLAAVRRWKSPRRTGDTTYVEALFALRDGLCAWSDSAWLPAYRTRTRARGDTLQVLVETEDCLPYRKSVSHLNK